MLTIYTPTADEVLNALANQLNQQSLMMEVAITDSEDPNWHDETHINFTLNHDGKGWVLNGSNGMKIKLSGKLVEPKVKKEKIETPTESETTQETTSEIP